VPSPRVHLLICTHTTRHLAPCLLGLAAQEEPPATVVVSCDSDDPAIGDVLQATWPRVTRAMRSDPPSLLHVSRPHLNQCRLNQVRNNGLRGLDDHTGLEDRDLVVVIDGDMVLWPDAVKLYGGLLRARADVVLPYRVNLSERRTRLLLATLDSNPAEAGRAIASVMTGADRDALAARDRRYRRQLRLGRLPLIGSRLVKPHKPKLLGGHHAVRAGVLRAVNGYDEQYIGYGYDDDDLARRLHALRPRPRVEIGVRRIGALHLWHPSRAPERPIDAPGYTRFQRRDLPMVCAHGWRHPLHQPAPSSRVIGSG